MARLISFFCLVIFGTLALTQVEYDFNYYKTEMEADAQMQILSEGKSNILPADLVMPFRPSSIASCEIMNVEETLKLWRWYLTTLRSLPKSIEPEMQRVIEDDLVVVRQEDRSLGTEDFSRVCLHEILAAQKLKKWMRKVIQILRFPVQRWSVKGRAKQ